MELTGRIHTSRCYRCGGMFHPDEGSEVIVRVLRATRLDPPEPVYGFMCHECADTLRQHWEDETAREQLTYPDTRWYWY